MDVQLTKDHQVVVYHDFETVITPRKKRRGELKNLSVAVKDLPYDALRELRLQHSSVLTKEQTSEELDGEDLDPIELQHFPLLRDCLEHVDSDLGFDIEIKYPLELKTTGSEMTNFFERNMYVDTILREIYKYAGNRRILLSCFDPDTCAMLQSKQNYFPVFQLGVEKDYTDIRHQTFENLCYSAKANELLGIAVNGTDILENPANAEFARSLGLILLCWGSSANSSENMERLKSLGVHGLIYDRMQEHKVSGTISSLKSAKLLSISAQQGLDVMHTNSSLENHSWNLESNATITRCNSLGLFKNNNYHIDKINFPAETCFNEAVKSQNDNDDDGGSEQDTPPSTPLIERHRKNTATFEFEDNFAAHLNFNDVKPITTSTKLA